MRSRHRLQPPPGKTLSLSAKATASAQRSFLVRRDSQTSVHAGSHAQGKHARGPSIRALRGAAIARVLCPAEARVGFVAIRRLGGGDQRRRVWGRPKEGSALESVKLVTAEIRSPSMVRTSRPTACAFGASSSWR